MLSMGPVESTVAEVMTEKDTGQLEEFSLGCPVSEQTEIGEDILLAKDLLMQGKAVAIPTETVYGLAANAFDDRAVLTLYKVKQRPLYNPLIVHVASLARVYEVVEEVPALARHLLEAFAPGPLTILFPKKETISQWVTSGHATVAVRIPAHPITLNLLESLDFPLAAPSANPFGYISPTTSEHVLQQLNGKIPYILEGGVCDKGLESTVVGIDGENVTIYRLGAICEEDIRRVAKNTVVVSHLENARPTGPGMLPYHYSPHTRLILIDRFGFSDPKLVNETVGLLAFSCYFPHFPTENQIILSETGNLHEAAHRFYSALHALDKKDFTLIFAEMLPEEGMGRVVNDRLRRAAAKSMSIL